VVGHPRPLGTRAVPGRGDGRPVGVPEVGDARGPGPVCRGHGLPQLPGGVLGPVPGGQGYDPRAATSRVSGSGSAIPSPSAPAGTAVTAPPRGTGCSPPAPGRPGRGRPPGTPPGGCRTGRADPGGGGRGGPGSSAAAAAGGGRTARPGRPRRRRQPGGGRPTPARGRWS
jgi:hypothetical protein